MWSPFYGYYNIKTEDVSKTISTQKIEQFLLNSDYIISDGNGHFSFQDGYLHIQIMLVKSYNSYGNDDYDKAQANYIDIIISKKNEDPNIIKLLQELSDYLGLPLLEEE